ncbi:ABC transporter substrate-binding protein [Fictibacillus enclensis]|uniref:ABC transporter substrate-binding protein n=1 Tax=Fictibacillus enclensis TaxID=1017270 RepID=A0A0V8IYZ3_9BACL|nr:ABC transporter substrate-binding protein [Fictibacillus enclensis]KSU79800.1 ABC transporter substrate-binding protein [Fictibacillus enclensis]
MMRKLPLILLTGMISLSLTGCQNPDDREMEKPTPSKPDVTLTIRNPKVEISTQFEQMAKTYEKKNPHVHIVIHTVGGAADTLSDLKAEMASGKAPDIFTNTGFENAKLWRKYLVDLSDQPWVKDAYGDALNPIKLNGKIYGMPMNLEGYGLIYNKKLFRKAGIIREPGTLSELTAAAQKLKKAGITPFATGYYEDWKLGVHLLNIAFAMQKDPATFIQRLNNGTARIDHNPTFNDVLDFLDLTLKYGTANPLTTDYTAEVNSFANGNAAIILQGNWIQPMINDLAPGMKLGLMPVPINEEPSTGSIVVSVPNYWVVNKQASSEEKKEAKKLLNWMVSSSKGKAFMTEKFKFIPAFKTIKPANPGPLAAEIMQHYKEGKTLSSNWFHFPVGVRDEFGAAMKMYVGKKLTREQLLHEFQKSWERSISQ